MSKKKASSPIPSVEQKRWEVQRGQERITYPPGHAGPVQMDWRQRGNYSATDLDYRGRVKPS